MCYNCGCKITDDPMGDERNITESTFAKLAEKLNLPVPETKQKVLEYLSQNLSGDIQIEQIFIEVSQAWGQPIPEAKIETLKLLQTKP